jgi:tetratricopeptide (TPR) repeat protein
MWKYARVTVPAAICVALGAVALCAPGTSIAGPQAGNQLAVVSPAKKAQAKARFTKAKQLYKQGKYRAAIDELQAALELDPEGAELVYNLGVIHEKLTEVETAIIYYKKYIAMVPDQQEKDRVKEIIQRLKGAKTEVAPVKSAEPPPPPAATSSEAPPPPPPPPKKGRMDGLVVGSIVVAGAGLVTGVVFGALAMGDRVQGNPTTDDNTTYQDLENRRDKAKQEALIADIGFGVAAVGTVTALVLYFARDKKTDDAPPPKTEARVMPSFAVLPGGVFAGLGARF